MIFLFPGKWNTETMPISEMHSLVFLMMSMLIESEETQVNGFSILCDATGLGHKQFFSVISNKDLVFHIVHLIQVCRIILLILHWIGALNDVF